MAIYSIGDLGRRDILQMTVVEYWQATAYRKDLTGIILDCFATFWGVRRV